MAGTVVSTTSNALTREIFGFALASSLSDPTVGYPSWDFTLLSTVAFFGLHIADDGSIASDSGLTVWNSSQLTSLVTTAHSHGVKVVVTAIKQDFSAGTPSMCAALAHRATTAQLVAAQAAAKSVDGVNLDYEGLNGTCSNGQTARAMMTDLARQMRASLPSGSYLSVDTYASSAADSLGFFDIGGLNAYVDSFFVMAYDLEYSNYARAPLNCVRFCLGPTGPLSGYYYNDTSTTTQYVAVVSRSKVILGVPYYGRKACVAGAVANAYPTGSVAADTYLDASAESSQPQVQAGSYVAHRDTHDPAGQERWDTWYNTTLGCTRELYWDDAFSLGKKYDLVIANSLRGVGIWNLNYGGGAPELWSALESHFGACTSETIAPAPGAISIGAVVSFTATAGGCSAPEYEYWIQPPGGYWTEVQGYSTNPRYSWNTSGLKAGSYQVAVWARQHGSRTSTYEVAAGGAYVLHGCASAGVTPAPGSYPVTATITLTATAGGCSSPEFEFWIRPPGGYWNMVQAYGAGTTYNWNTMGLKPGVYQVAVWARQHGSGTATYDVAAGGAYTLAGCAAATVSPLPGSFPVTSTVALTASATGCANPEFEYWIRPAGGYWTMVRPYSATASYSWTTTGLAPGAYEIAIWARQHGSGTTTYDVATGGMYTLTGCSGASVTPAPGSFAAGSRIDFTAGSSGCSNPEYEYWIKPPGGYWTLVRPYSTTATFSWSTSSLPKGTYALAVWVRQHGSGTATYDAAAGGNYVLG
jgi:spore germination protein YaaH